MYKKYHIVEVDSKGSTILWVKTLTGRAAYDVLEQLKKRFPAKKLMIEVK